MCVFSRITSTAFLATGIVLCPALLSTSLAVPARPTLIMRAADEPAKSSSSSTTTISESDGKRSRKFVLVNGKVVAAEIDGASVPPERIEQSATSFRIRDASGQVILERQFAEFVPKNAQGYITVDLGSRYPATPPVPAVTGVAPNPFSDDVASLRFGNAAAAAVAEAPKSMIGVQLVEPDASLRAHFNIVAGDSAMIMAVYDGLPAAAAGLQPYDIVVGIDGKSPAGTDELRAALRRKNPGDRIELQVIQRGERKTISLIPEAYDQSRLQNAKRRAIAAGDFPGAAGFARIDGNWRFPEGIDQSAFASGLFAGDAKVDKADKLHWFVSPNDRSEQAADRLRVLGEALRERAGAFTNDREAVARDLDARIRELESALRELNLRSPAAPGSLPPGASDPADSNIPPAPPTPPGEPSSAPKKQSRGWSTQLSSSRS